MILSHVLRHFSGGATNSVSSRMSLAYECRGVKATESPLGHGREISRRRGGPAGAGPLPGPELFLGPYLGRFHPAPAGLLTVFRFAGQIRHENARAFILTLLGGALEDGAAQPEARLAPVGAGTRKGRPYRWSLLRIGMPVSVTMQSRRRRNPNFRLQTPEAEPREFFAGNSPHLVVSS